MKLQNIKLNIAAFDLQAFGNMMQTFAELAHPTNLESVVVAEYWQLNQFRYINKLNQGTGIKAKLKISEAIALWQVIIQTSAEVKTDNYRRLYRGVLLQIDTELHRINAHPRAIRTASLDLQESERLLKTIAPPVPAIIQ